eukprot:scaffold1352_cov261-Pinguiococcus_pyrenoidosus.AAC.6
MLRAYLPFLSRTRNETRSDVARRRLIESDTCDKGQLNAIHKVSGRGVSEPTFCAQVLHQSPAASEDAGLPSQPSRRHWSAVQVSLPVRKSATVNIFGSGHIRPLGLGGPGVAKCSQ